MKSKSNQSTEAENLKVDLLENSTVPIDDKPKVPLKLMNAYFLMQGILSLACFYSIMSTTDYINDQYPNYLFNFYSIIPGNLAQPFSFSLVKYLSTSSPNLRMLSNMTLNVVFNDLMLLFLFLWPGCIYSYTMLLFMSFLSNIFCFVQQAYIVNQLSIYPNICSSFYFTGTGVCSLIFFGLRAFLLWINISSAFQVQVMYGFSTFLLVIGIGLHICMMYDKFYRDNYHRLSSNEQITWSEYKEAAKLIYRELCGVFWSLTFDSLVFPGIIFSIRPKSIFSEAIWNAVTSLSLGFSDSLGKLLGDKKFIQLFVKHSLVLQVIFNVILIAYYYSNFYQENAWDFQWIYIQILLNISWFRAGLAETYYMIRSKKFVTDKNKMVVGAVMNYGIVTGISISGCFGLVIGHIYEAINPK